MKFFLKTVVLCLCLAFSASETYRAANVLSDVKPSSYLHLIQEAGKHNADILVLPAQKSTHEDNYDEIVKSLSQAAKQSGVYVVAPLVENVSCQNETEILRSNVVFDRRGDIVSVYRNPENKSNCTSDPGLSTFSTDFGVTFGSLMEEDLVLHSSEYFEGLRNFVLTEGLTSKTPFLSEGLPASWAYISQSNLISSRGIFTGQQVSTVAGKLVIADINKNEVTDSQSPPVVNPKTLKTVSKEDVSHYTIKNLNVDSRKEEYKETVCHGSFCCDFNLKTSGSSPTVGTYGLVVFDGVEDYSRRHHIGIQTCAVFSCAGLYKELCDIRSESDIMFEKIYITGNFAQDSTQYPIVYSTDVSSSIKNIQADKHSIEVSGIQNFTSLGIFGRDFAKDFYTEFKGNTSRSETDISYEIYNYLSEDVLEFVDYVWIRLRVLIFVVSIYILEML